MQEKKWPNDRHSIGVWKVGTARPHITLVQCNIIWLSKTMTISQVKSDSLLPTDSTMNGLTCLFYHAHASTVTVVSTSFQVSAGVVVSALGACTCPCSRTAAKKNHWRQNGCHSPLSRFLLITQASCVSLPVFSLLVFHFARTTPPLNANTLLEIT